MAHAAAPVFPAGATVIANIGMGENVFWKVLPNKKTMQGNGGIVLTFLAAEPRGAADVECTFEVCAVDSFPAKDVGRPAMGAHLWYNA